MSACCQIRVTEAGLYCCDLKQLKVLPGEIATVGYSNLIDVPVEQEVTPGSWVPYSTPVITGSGELIIISPGTYRFGFDCSSINNQLAPEDEADQIGLCYSSARIKDSDALILNCLFDLKELLECPEAAPQGVVTEAWN